MINRIMKKVYGFGRIVLLYYNNCSVLVLVQLLKDYITIILSKLCIA